MPYIKYVTGTVVQHFDDDGVCVAQDFNAGNRVEYVDADTGKPIASPEVGQFQPFDMVQPFDNIIS